MSLSLSVEQFEALTALARRGVSAEGEIHALEDFIRAIEKDNDIIRYSLLIQWQEANQPLPPSTDFPKVWPPEMRARIDLVTRPIARADVEALLKAKANQPVNVLVTKDPAGIVGWTKLESFF